MWDARARAHHSHKGNSGGGDGGGGGCVHVRIAPHLCGGPARNNAMQTIDFDSARCAYARHYDDHYERNFAAAYSMAMPQRATRKGNRY